MPARKSRTPASGKPIGSVAAKSPPPALPTGGETNGRFIVIVKHAALDDRSVVKSSLSQFAGVIAFDGGMYE